MGNQGEATYVITDAEDSYDEQHRRRVRRYLMIMAIRIPALVISAWIYSATGNWMIALAVLGVEHYPAQDLLIVRTVDRRRVQLPLVEQLVPEVDLEAGVRAADEYRSTVPA